MLLTTWKLKDFLKNQIYLIMMNYYRKYIMLEALSIFPLLSSTRVHSFIPLVKLMIICLVTKASSATAIVQINIFLDLHLRTLVKESRLIWRVRLVEKLDRLQTNHLKLQCNKVAVHRVLIPHYYLILTG